jgi:3-methylcrotonyl-CoA carboxylase alpha subunit
MSNERVRLVATRGNIAELMVDGRTVFVPFIVEGTRVSFKYEGETYTVETSSRSRARHREHSMSAPMPGVILKILVRVGQQVSKGMPLLILEAMKMEHVISAPRDGTVAAINCKEGELVQPGGDLIELK